MGQNNQKPRIKYWATRSSVPLFASTAHSLACSAQFALLALTRLLARSLPSLPRSLAHFTHSLARVTVNDQMGIFSVFFFFGPKCILLSSFPPQSIDPAKYRFERTGNLYAMTIYHVSLAVSKKEKGFFKKLNSIFFFHEPFSTQIGSKSNSLTFLL